MSTTTATILDLDALLDTNMDSVETLPDYVNPTAGIYTFEVTGAEIKPPKEKGKPSLIVITRKVVEIHETNEGDLPVQVGSLSTERFQGTEEGLEYFKKAAIGILGESEFGEAKLRDLLEGLVGATQKARVTIRKTKGDNGQEYENVNFRTIKDAA